MPLTSIAACLLATGLAGAAAPEPAPAAKGGIRITYVFDAAKATLAALAGEPGRDPSEIAKLPGNVRLIEHQRRFDPTATEERFAEQLRAGASAGKLVPDTFAFNRTIERLAQARALLAKIEADPAAFSEAIRARLARFTPPDLDFTVTVYVIAGGTSDGFASGDAFCIALDYFRDDEAGLKVMMSHELFHVARRIVADRGKGQAPGKAARPAHSLPASERVLALLEETMNEGIATRVGDPFDATGGKAWIDWFRGKFSRNFERLESSFVLFDTILYREVHDEKAPTEQLYRIGFTGSWDSALYFVGCEMARVIEEVDGPGAIGRSLSEGPLHFFERYVAISRAHPDRVKYRFAATTEEALAGARRAS
jgi:hypothetical protein